MTKVQFLADLRDECEVSGCRNTSTANHTAGVEAMTESDEEYRARLVAARAKWAADQAALARRIDEKLALAAACARPVVKASAARMARKVIR